MMNMPLEFSDLATFNEFIGLPRPIDRDFDVSQIESYKEELMSKGMPAFRHHFFSVCLALQLDMELNVGYYNRKPQVPFLMFKSPYQAMAWQIQPGLKKGWHIIFTEDFMRRHSQLTDIVQEFAFLQVDKAIPFEIDETEIDVLSNVFQKIIEEYHSGMPDRFELVASYIHLLLLRIRRLYEKFVLAHQEINVLSKNSDTLLFNKFKELLNKNRVPLAIDIKNVTYFSDELAVHPNYLNAVLKRVTGENTLHFIHQHIINEAKILLLQNELSIKEIAFQLSFKEHTHFSAFFKKHTSFSPVQFRQEAIF
jgi:AraC-like DNA-binding protein